MKIISVCIITCIILQLNTINVNSASNENATTSGSSVWEQDAVKNFLKPIYESHPYLRDILPEGNSKADLKKDLMILESFMRDIFYESDHLPDKRGRIYMAKLIAFKQALKYRNNDTLDTMEKKQIDRYLQIGDVILVFSNDIMSQFIPNKREGDSIVEHHFLEFYNEIINTKINSSERDIELQNKWAALSRSAGSQLKPILDKHFQNLLNIAKVGHMIGIHDPSLMWNYLNNHYNALSTSEIKKFWKNQLKGTYKRLMSFMRNDFQDIYTTFNGIEKEDVKFPAYLFDTLFHIHSPPETRWSHKVSFPQTDNRFYNMFNKTMNLSKKFNAKSLTVYAEKYFQSLGFPKLGTSFWQNSVFGDFVEGDSDIRAMNIGTKHATVIINIHGIINYESYREILNVLFEVHKGQLLQKQGHPSILWEPENIEFKHAFQAAVMDGACSIQRLTKLKLVKQTVNDKDRLLWFQGMVVRDFMTMASAINHHTWKYDILDRKIGNKNMMKEYWKRRWEIELVVPTTHPSIPVDITTNFDFFNGNQIFLGGFGFRHVMNNILRYQIFARLCELAGQYYPNEHQNRVPKLLYECDFSNSPAAGELIRTIIAHGGTKTWRELLDIITGSPNSTLSARGFLHYHAIVFNNIQEKEEIEKMYGSISKP